jgi:ribosomal protein S2
MLYQYYFKRLKLFRIPYRILLAYHSPAGNSIKLWTYYQMLSHIMAVRKEIHILSLTFTVIQIRRGLNILFQRVNTRGTFLIHGNPSNGLKIKQNSIFIFVTEWLPGLLTNYKQLVLSIRRNQKYNNILSFYLKRPQQFINENINLQARPLSQQVIKSSKRRVPALPAISLSISDSKIWLNETAILGIPSIQICDTQSHIQKISYPIIANQQSVTFNYLIISLFAEVCNYGLMFEHLFFLSIYKYLKIQKSIIKKMSRKSLQLNYLKKSLLKNPKISFIGLKRSYEKTKLSYFFWHKIYKKRLITKKPTKKLNKVNNKLKNIKVLNKKTFIFNKRIFAYQIKDILKYKKTIDMINLDDTTYGFMKKLKRYFYGILKNLEKKLKIYEKIEKIKFYKKKKIKRKRMQDKILKKKMKLYQYRRYLKQLYIRMLGLALILKEKKKQKARFITKVKITKNLIPNRVICGLLYSEELFQKLKFLKKF